MKQPRSPRRDYFALFLTGVEKVGNTLPHPGTLFALLAMAVVVVLGVALRLDIQAVHPGSGEIIRPVSLLSIEGFHRMLTQMVTNYTSFAPLGTVLVAMLGIGIAESSGLIGAVLRLLVLSAPRHLLTFIIVFFGVLSNTASEIGYVSVKGAEFLKASGLGVIPLMVAFVLFSGFINLFMGSASAKWAIVGPVFAPMLMLLG